MNKSRGILVFLGILVPVSAVLTCGIGAVDIDAMTILKVVGFKASLIEEGDLSMSQIAIIWNIRLPRVAMTLLVGAGLALCGASMQGLFRNPLADPSIIGITSGSAFVTALAIVLLSPWLSQWQQLAGIGPISLLSFCGAVASTYLIFAISKEGRQISVATMLLAGIALNAISGAGIGLLTYLADDAELRSLTFWTLGSLGSASWTQVAWMLGALALGTIMILPLAKPFNALSLGEQAALHLGMPMEQVKNRVILATGLCVGVAVAFCGVIGFLGLVVPHILRLAGQANHQFLLPASLLGGAFLLLWADALARTVVAPAELPIGILTALGGSPVFLFLLIRQRKRIQV